MTRGNVTDGRERLAGGAIRGQPRRPAGVAYRMLGSLSEADDAVQEAWLRLSRSDTSDEQLLPVVDQQRDQQTRTTSVQVNRPGHIVADVEDIRDELQRLGLVVRHPAREHHRGVCIDHRAVMLGFARVRTTSRRGAPGGQSS
jgi:hypothetical protein